MFSSWSATMRFCFQLVRYHGIFNWSATTCNRDSRCIKLHERAQATLFLELMALARLLLIIVPMGIMFLMEFSWFVFPLVKFICLTDWSVTMAWYLLLLSLVGNSLFWGCNFPGGVSNR